MAEPSTIALARFDARMEEHFERVLAGMEGQKVLLRAMNEGVEIILERLAPGENKGPTVGELLAQLVEAVGNVDLRARRILTRIEAIGQDLPANIVLLLNEERGGPSAKESQA